MELDVRQPILLPAGAGEVIGDSADRRVEILSDVDELHATWSRFGPGREGADLHVHRHHTDFFYVLAGELTVRVGPTGEPTTVAPGTLVRVPPLVVHGFRNGSGAELRYLNLHAPGRGFADYLRSIRDGNPIVYDQEDPPADGGRSPADASIGHREIVADRPGLRVELLAEIEELAVCEVMSDPGGPSPPLHVHERHSESFYVLAGEIAFRAGDQELMAGPGAWVQVPAGVPHTFELRGDEPVRFLDLHAPSCGFGDFLRALHSAGNEDELRAARAAFDQASA